MMRMTTLEMQTNLFLLMSVCDFNLHSVIFYVSNFLLFCVQRRRIMLLFQSAGGCANNMSRIPRMLRRMSWRTLRVSILFLLF